MGHALHIGYDSISCNVLSDSKGDLGLGRLEFFGIDDLTQGHHVDLVIFHFDSYGCLARNRRFDADALGFQVQGDIICQIDNALYLYSYVWMDLIACYSRTLGHLHHLGVNVEVLKRLFQLPGFRLKPCTDSGPVFRSLSFVQQIDRRKFVSRRH